MKTVTVTDFRKNISNMLSFVEKGDSIVLIRHGSPVAEIVPCLPPNRFPAWKQPAVRLISRGVKLSSAIQEERSNESIF